MMLIALLILLAVLCIPGVGARVSAVLAQVCGAAVLLAVWIAVTAAGWLNDPVLDLGLGLGAMFAAALLLRAARRLGRRG